MTLSVVIVNYNTRELLRVCLTSLRASTIPAEVIVVDNASRDGSAAMVAEQFPDVTLIAEPVNTWYCGGNNRGIAAASGTYVLLLNPDTEIAPDALEKLVAFMDANPAYGGVTAQLRYPGGAVQRTCSREPTYPYLFVVHTPFGLIFRGWREHLEAHHWYGDEGFDRTISRDVRVMPGSCLLMRRPDLQLDDNLRLYFPEDDLAHRFPNYKFRFLAEAQITHHEKAATQSWLATQTYYRDMLIYTRKYHGWLGWALLWGFTRPMIAAMWLKAQILKS